MNDELLRVRDIKPDVTVGDVPPLSWGADDDLMLAASSVSMRSERAADTRARISERTWMLVAAAVVVLLAATFAMRGMTMGRDDDTGVMNPPSATSASPSEPDAATTVDPSSLLGLAQLAETGSPSGSGEIQYVRFTLWPDPSVANSAHGTTELWRAPDGSGSISATSSSLPAGPFAAGEHWFVPQCRDGSANPTTSGVVGDPALPSAEAWMNVLWFCSVWNGPLSGMALSSVLSQLADQPDIAAVGTVTDHLGRTGLGFQVTRQTTTSSGEASDVTQTTLILDLDTARPMAYSSFIVSSPNPSAPVPILITDETIDVTAMVTEVGQQP